MLTPRRLSYVLLAALLAYLPFRTLLFTFFDTRIHGPFAQIFQFFPEALLFAVLLIQIWENRGKTRDWRSFPRPIITALLLIAWSALSVVWEIKTPQHMLAGIWYDFEGLLALITVWLLRPTPDESKTFYRIICWGIAFIAAIGALEVFIGPEFWGWVGYVPDQHYVGKIRQIRSLLPGPNPLGSIMVVAAALLIRGPKKSFTNIALILSGVILGLTFSRSAWLGAGVFGAGIFIQEARHRKIALAPILLAAGLLIGVLAGTLRYGEGSGSVVTHGRSSTIHEKVTTQAVEDSTHSAQLFLFGSGIGNAGPASYKAGIPKIAESWFVQLLQEIGLIGVLLYLGLIAIVTKELFERREPILAWLSLGLVANGLFLHIWADNHNLNLIFWILIGMALFVGGSKPKKTNQSSKKN